MVHHNKRYLSPLILSMSLIVSELLAPVVTALEITGISPSSDTIAGGKLVTLTGTGLMGERREQFIDIAAGVQHLIMLSASHHVWTVGCNDFGQLGAGLITTTSGRCVSKPQDITEKFSLTGDDYIERISAGDYSSYAISKNHRVFSWGRNNLGELGDDSYNDRNVPVEVTSNFNFKRENDNETRDYGTFVADIAAGVETAYAITDWGNVYTWGDGAGKQDDNTAYGTNYKRRKPAYVASLSLRPVLSLGAGNRAAILLDNQRAVETWGRNEDGELGRTKEGESNYTSESSRSNLITDNLGLTDDEVVQVEAGGGAMGVVTNTGRVLMWGNNAKGMLGLDGEIPNEDDSSTGDKISSSPLDITPHFDLPDLVQGDKHYPDKIVQLSIGNSHVLALSQYGRVFSWGDNQYGQLGDGTSLGYRDSVVDITGKIGLLNDGAQIEKVVAAGAGGDEVASYSYALDSDGNVYAWGGSASGYAGINAIAGSRNLPDRISDRLMAKVPLIAEVDVDNTPARLDQTSDKRLRFIVPEGNEPGKVDLTIIDIDGNETLYPEAFTYTAAAEVNGDSKEGTSNEEDDDDVAAAETTKKSTKNKSSAKKKSSVSAKKSSGSSSSTKSTASRSGSGTSYTIAAPNSGGAGNKN